VQELVIVDYIAIVPSFLALVHGTAVVAELNFSLSGIDLLTETHGDVVTPLFVDLNSASFKIVATKLRQLTMENSRFERGFLERRAALVRQLNQSHMQYTEQKVQVEAFREEMVAAGEVATSGGATASGGGGDGGDELVSGDEKALAAVIRETQFCIALAQLHLNLVRLYESNFELQSTLRAMVASATSGSGEALRVFLAQRSAQCRDVIERLRVREHTLIEETEEE
jgi:hypothetical protein